MIVSYSRTFSKLEKLFLGFQQYHEDFDYTEFDRMLGIEICLKTILKALFVSNNKGKRSPFLTKK